MAINSKIAGIVTGLGVGLGCGVLLAILNPLISNNDSITVLSSPDETSGNLDQDSVPVPVPVAEVGPSHEAAADVPSQTDQGDPTSADTVPQTDSDVSRTVKAGRVTELGEPAEAVDGDTPASELAETDKPASTQSAALQDVDSDPLPSVSTDPAVPIDLDEPQVDAENPTQTPPDGDDEEAVKAPEVDDHSPESTETPEAPSDEDVAAVSKTPHAPREANTSGTFETGSSSLKTTGTAGFGDGTGSRLPKIGEDETALNDSDSTDTDDAEAAGDGRMNALADNAAPFEGSDRPLVSIILMDTEGDVLPLETLQSLTLPITFAIRADDPNASERAEELRTAGFEVIAMAPTSVDMILTGGLSHQQVSETVDRILEAVPGAIGLIDTPKAELQRDRKLSRAVAIRLGATGHGLVTYAKGFNTAAREAESFEVASDSVRRVLDAKDESPEVISRYLDRAVLDARRAGHVILLGTTQRDTVGAIVNWALSSKARGVSLAPASASLLASVN